MGIYGEEMSRPKSTKREEVLVTFQGRVIYGVSAIENIKPEKRIIWTGWQDQWIRLEGSL